MNEENGISFKDWLQKRGFNSWEDYQEAREQSYRETSAKIVQIILGIAIKEQKIDPTKILIDQTNKDGSSTTVTWRRKTRSELEDEEWGEFQKR